MMDVRCRRVPATMFFFVVVCTLSMMVAAAAAEGESTGVPVSAVALLQQQRTKEDEVQTLRVLYQSKMKTLQKLHDLLQQRHTTASAAAATNMVRSDVEFNTAKYNELSQRTNTIITAVQDYNRNALVGKEGLAPRLRYVLHQEMKRRDRYQTNITNTSKRCRMSSNTNNRHVTQDELTTLLLSSSASVLDDEDNNNINNSLIANIAADAMLTKVIGNYIQKEDTTLHSRLQYITTKYPYEYNTTINALADERKKKKKEKQLTTKCIISIPKGIQLVTQELQDDNYLGGESLVDYAKYGKVVYEMTRLPYVPYHRYSSSSSSSNYHNNNNNNNNNHNHNNNDDEYDTMIENTFWQQQQQQQDNNADDSSGILNHIQNLHYDKVYNTLYKYTTQSKLSSLRPYLPMDWERMLDYYFTSSPSSSWSEHTIYSLLDNVIPDYIFHAWGLPYGKTAHPDVVISSSKSNNVVEIEGKEVEEKRGGRRRRNTSPMGQCYPLSMSTTDPMDNLLTTFATTHHHSDGEMNNNNDDDDDANKLGSSYGRPRVTIELPYAIYIDAVTLEHRSFPIDHYHGEDNVGGESAPRYVRIVGYPPCPTHYRNDMEDVDSSTSAHCESSQYGFDITSPINLGLLEYQRITPVIDENDRYKTTTTTTTNTKKNEELLLSSLSEGSRYRSIQTFAVKGGLWKPRLLEDDVFSENDGTNEVKNKETVEVVEVVVDDNNDDNPEFVSPGQCTPPKDEDSLPSCGGINDISDRKESGGSSSRRIVKAVSFVVEEIWGNADYTCLYRVRVHGDAVV